MNDVIKNAYRIWHIVKLSDAGFGANPDGKPYEPICLRANPPFDENGDLLDTIYEGHQNGIGKLNPPNTRSLSVGDVIQLFDEIGASRYRRVQGVGFAKVRRVNDSFEGVDS